jgi:serine/threonine protein kinase
MDRPESLGQLKTDEWRRLMEYIDRFEQAWINASNPTDTIDLRAYLPTPTDSLRPAALQELIKTDLEIRWRGNRGVQLEFYLERCPELGTAASLPPALMYEEYRIRQLYGDRPPLDSYAVRFPAQFVALKQMVHDQPLPTRSKVADQPALSPPPRPSEEAGRILSVGGGYELTKYLGGGGFGKVWRAKAPGGVEVAIKLIDRSLEQNEAHRELQALELTKQLRHPFLVQTHSYYALADQIIIDMELCDGSLRDRLRACRNQGLKGIPPKELLGYFREAAEAFDFLHAQNVQHRDVKPDNILLQQGHAKVADFGLARLQVLEKSIVDSGSGTPPYTAPEVWLGHIKPGSDSDQYSLAVTYAELRLDRRLYQGTGMVELMMAHVEGTPDLSPLPQPEQQALLRALAKDPAKRYPSSKEFIKALEAALAKELGLSHVDHTFAEHKGAPASERTGEKTDPNSILPSFGRATLEGRSPLLNKWRDSAEENTATPTERPQPVWRPNKPAEKLAGKPRLFKNIAMFLVLVIAGIAAFALIKGIITTPQKHLEVDFFPDGDKWEKANDAKVQTVGGRTAYDRIQFLVPGQPPVEFVLVPPAENDTNPFYMMADKVSVGLFTRYADTKPDFYKTGWDSLPQNQHGDQKPVMGVTVEDASRFARWMGGKLPLPRQWSTASGSFRKNREKGPYQPCEKPWKGQIGVGLEETGIPLDNREGTCDFVEIPEYGTRIFDMAGNGREWTREMMGNAGEEVPLSPQRLKKLQASDVVTLRGQSYTANRPLFYVDYDAGVTGDSQHYGAGDFDLSFRVVIEP